MITVESGDDKDDLSLVTDKSLLEDILLFSSFPLHFITLTRRLFTEEMGLLIRVPTKFDSAFIFNFVQQI